MLNKCVFYVHNISISFMYINYFTLNSYIYCNSRRNMARLIENYRDNNIDSSTQIANLISRRKNKKKHIKIIMLH